MAMFDMHGRVAVVTGGTAGLGKGMAIALARQGADLAILARRPDKLEEAAADIRTLGVKCLPVVCDISGDDSVQAAVQAVLDEYGKVDISGQQYLSRHVPVRIKRKRFYGMMKTKKFSLSNGIPILILVVLFVVFTIISGGTTLTKYNLSNLCVQAMPIIIASLGVLFVVAIGGTDISIGASSAMCVTLAAILANKTSVSWIMIPLTLIFTMAVGLGVGVLVAKFKVNSFMVTLALLISCKGLLNFFLTKEVVNIPKGLEFIKNTGFVTVLLIVAVAVIWYVFEKTKFGYYCKCIGENERAVLAVGYNVKKIRITCFVISGLFAGIAGIVLFCRVGGSTNSLCNMLEMRVQMAIFLGGILTTGGFSAKLYKVVIGSFTIALIENGLTICGVSTTASEAVEGILLVAILLITIYCDRISKMRAIRLSIASEAEAVE